jgi:hypothetical protein
VINPEFTIKADRVMESGDTAVLLDPAGQVVGTSQVTPGDVSNGTINVPTQALDDGTYTFLAQIRNPDGTIKGQAPVVVTIVTDRDGVQPSVERAANNGDINRDGVQDWEQNNVAQLPLSSLQEFLAGSRAPSSSFGAIIAGDVSNVNPGAPAQLDNTAQLLDISLQPLPAPLPAKFTAATPVFNFSVSSEAGKSLNDSAPGVPGLQSRIVIELPGGVKANTYQKFNPATGRWASFVDDQNLATYDDGATLIDANGDGLVERIVVTLTDGGPGDEDGLVNGVIVDPGLLAFEQKARPVYSVLLSSGDRYYSSNATEAAKMAAGKGNVFEGSRFDMLESAQGGQKIYANKNFITEDWYFAAEGQDMPYYCYIRQPDSGFTAAAAGKGPGADFSLYMNEAGITQLLTQVEATQLGLVAKGYKQYGPIFNTTTTAAYTFDAEGYLMTNRGNADVRSLVTKLALEYTKTSDAGFVDIVELHYLNQVALVGLPQGRSASAADLNAAFGTAFLA